MNKIELTTYRKFFLQNIFIGLIYGIFIWLVFILLAWLSSNIFSFLFFLYIPVIYGLFAGMQILRGGLSLWFVDSPSYKQTIGKIITIKEFDDPLDFYKGIARTVISGLTLIFLFEPFLKIINQLLN